MSLNVSFFENVQILIKVCLGTRFPDSQLFACPDFTVFDHHLTHHGVGGGTTIPLCWRIEISLELDIGLTTDQYVM